MNSTIVTVGAEAPIPFTPFRRSTSVVSSTGARMFDTGLPSSSLMSNHDPLCAEAGDADDSARAQHRRRRESRNGFMATMFGEINLLATLTIPMWRDLVR